MSKKMNIKILSIKDIMKFFCKNIDYANETK